MTLLRRCAFLISLFAGATAASSLAQAPPPKVARSTVGMVATGSAYATQAAVRAFQAGGNAVDAAAAAAFALMVTDPANTSVGGRAQIMLRLADGTTRQLAAAYAQAVAAGCQVTSKSIFEVLRRPF